MDIALRVLEKTPSVQGRSKPILTLLVVLIAAIALPLVLLTVTVGLRFANAERRVIEAQRLDVATNLSHLVDREIAGFTAFMVALASSEDARNGSYNAFAQIIGTAVNEGAPLQLMVTDRSGKRLYATAGPGGTLPAAPVDASERAFDGRPVVSNYVESGQSADPLFFVSVPIKAKAGGARVLSGGYSLERLRGLFAEAGLPASWISTVVDGNGLYLVRNTGAQELIGQPARSAVVEIAKGGSTSGLFSNTTLEGVDVASSFKRSSLAGWTSVVAVPQSILETPLRQTYGLLAATALATLITSALLASAIARRIAEPVRSLGAAADALAAGTPLQPPQYRVAELEGVWQAFRRVEKVTQERTRYMGEFARRVTEEQRQTEVLKSTLTALQESEARYRSALSVGRMGSWITNLDTKTREWSEEGMALFGLNLPGGLGHIGGPSDEYLHALHPDDRYLVSQFHKLADKQDDFTAEYRVVHPDGQMYWLAGRGRVVAREADGTARRIINIVSDITERKASEEKVRFLMREITHRSKNLLAVVQAIARQTGRYSLTFDDFQTRFIARVRGLAASHDLLVNEDWSGASLQELIAAQLALAGKAMPQVRLDGPEVQLSSEISQGIGLALHELVVNSLKYGALSVPEGVLSIKWSFEEGAGSRHVRLHWQERFGPVVSTPVRKGFGHTVIESMVSASTGGKVQLDFAPEGLSWTLSFPAAEATVPTVSKV